MALQNSLTSQDTNAQNVHIMTNGQQHQPQHAIMSMSHELTSYGGNENGQTNVRVTIIPTLMQSPPSIVSTHAHMTSLQVTPSSMPSDTASSVHNLALSNPKEDHSQREQERRIRREIANSNERRRMQSINAGFKALKAVLPHTEGEKLSKAAILQQTSDYISQLESDKLKLIHQIDKLKRALTECKCNPSKHMALADMFEKDEGIGSPAEEDYEDMKRGISEVKQQLDKERKLRKILEQHIQHMDSGKHSQSTEAVLQISDTGDPQPIYRTLAKEDHGVNSQPCARTLLPPLAPLGLPKCEPHNEQSQINNTSLHQTTDVLTKNDPTISEKLSMPDVGAVCIADSAKLTVSSPQSDHLVTVFSHSNKSNQPLKKRAIEILEVHQNVPDSGSETSLEQPKSKVLRMSLDHLTNKETGMLITNTDSPRLDSPLLASSVKVELPPSQSKVDEASTRPTIALPALALSLPDPTVHFPPLSSSANFQGVQKPTYKNMLSPCPLPSDAVTSSKHSPISPAQNAERQSASILTKVQGVATQSPQAPVELVTFVNGNHTQEVTPPNNAVPGHLYFAVSGSSNISYVQQESDKSLPVPQHFPHPQYIVAPINNSCNGLVVGANGLNQSNSGMQLMSHPVVHSQPLQSKIPQAVVTYPPIPTSHPTVTHPIQASQPFTLVQNNAAHFTLRTKQHLQNQHTSTLLCYSQPEITLNQLNAVPNLAPPKSLHQPVMSVPVGSPLVPNVGSESPYIIPVVHENPLQSKVNTYINPAALRCRNSSLSAADSCSTASASGAEEEETTKADPETSDYKQPGLSAKKVSKSLSNPVKPVTSENARGPAPDDGAATSETATVLSDIDDGSASLSRAKSLSVLTNATSSPPAAIRHLNSMQSRGNLETIVQAIDHLEQQERRNSQDQPEIIN